MLAIVAFAQIEGSGEVTCMRGTSYKASRLSSATDFGAVVISARLDSLPSVSFAPRHRQPLSAIIQTEPGEMAEWLKAAVC